MSTIKATFVLGFAVIVFVVASAAINPTPDAIQHAQVQNQIERMELMQTVGNVAIVGGTAILLIALAIGLRFLWAWSGRPLTLYARDGLFPAVVIDRSTPLDRLTGQRRILAHDPNRSGGATLSIHAARDGQITAHGAQVESSDQAAIIKSALNVQKVQAGYRRGPTVAEIKGELGYYDRTPRPAIITEQATLPTPADSQPAKPPSLLAAIRQKSQPAEFVLGWNRDRLGNLQAATWDTYSDSTLDILGKSRHGKTSTVGIALGIQMAWYNWRVLALDPEQENTWGVLDKHLEVVPTGPDRIIGHVQAYVDEWEKRGDLLAAHNVSDVRRLPDVVRPPHAALIIDEYPKLRYDLGLLSGQEAVDHLDGLLDTIVQVGAKRLMRLVVIGQTRSKARPWPESVWKQGKKAVFAINVNDNSLTGYHDLMSLKIGEFAYDAERWTGWFAENKVASIMAQAPVPRRSWPPFITGDVPDVGTFSTGGRNVVPALPALSVPPSFSATNGGIAGNVPSGNNGNDAPPALRSNEEIARLWLSHHADGELPRGWSSALAKAIAVNNNALGSWESFKSEAARWKERYHPTGTEYRSYQPADGWPKPHGFPPTPPTAPANVWEVMGREVIDLTDEAGADAIRRIDWRKVEVK